MSKFSEAEIEVSKQICNVRNALDVRQRKLVKGISHSQHYLSSSSVSKLQAEMAELEAQLADLEATMKTHRAKRRAADKNKKQCEWPCLVCSLSFCFSMSSLCSHRRFSSIALLNTSSFSNKRKTTSELKPSGVKRTQTSSVKNDASAKSGRLSSTSLIPKSSGGSSSKFASVEILTSNKHGGVLKTLQCHPKAAPVIEQAVASFPNNANKQVVSVATIARRRNSHGTNAQLHNIMSVLCYFIPLMEKKNPTKFAGRFIADKPDLLSEAQNVVTKFKLVDPQGIGCSCEQFMQILRSPTAKAIFSAKLNAREDYGANSFFKYCKDVLSRFGVLLVTDGGQVDATNAKDKRMLILSEHLKPDNVDACKAVTGSTTNDNQFDNQTFDCIQPGCIRAQECAKHCKAHKPTVSV